MQSIMVIAFGGALGALSRYGLGFGYRANGTKDSH